VKHRHFHFGKLLCRILCREQLGIASLPLNFFDQPEGALTTQPNFFSHCPDCNSRNFRCSELPGKLSRLSYLKDARERFLREMRVDFRFARFMNSESFLNASDAGSRCFGRAPAACSSGAPGLARRFRFRFLPIRVLVRALARQAPPIISMSAAARTAS
jgi:hypothetical protein